MLPTYLIRDWHPTHTRQPCRTFTYQNGAKCGCPMLRGWSKVQQGLKHTGWLARNYDLLSPEHEVSRLVKFPHTILLLKWRVLLWTHGQILRRLQIQVAGARYIYRASGYERQELQIFWSWGNNAFPHTNIYVCFSSTLGLPMQAIVFRRTSFHDRRTRKHHIPNRQVDLCFSIFQVILHQCYMLYAWERALGGYLHEHWHCHLLNWHSAQSSLYWPLWLPPAV